MSTSVRASRSSESRWFWMALAGLAFAVAIVGISSSNAFAAGKAATGEPLFYPCTSCHPTEPGAAERGRTFPNNFTKHQITLDGHAALGEGSAACIVCHDDPAGNPGMFKLIDGSLVDITGDVSRVCYRCHSDMYKEFEAGMHGAGKAKCSSAGCHDPHTPGYIYAELLLPFVGNGFQFQVASEMATFTPLAGPPVQAAYHDPEWLSVLTWLGVALAGGLALALIRGRSDR